MDNIHSKKILIEALGFSDKKAVVYLTLVEQGEIPVTELAKRAGLKRTTVYNILPELLTEGYVSKTKQKGKTFYFVDKIADLERSFDDKKKEIQGLIMELKNNSGLFGFRPKINIYEGFGGMKKFYQDVVDSTNTGGEILTFIGTQNLESFVPKELTKKYVDQRINKRVKNLIIGPPNRTSSEWKSSASKELREMRITNFPNPNFSADFKLYGNKIAFISYKENFFAVVIESIELSLLHKNLFQILWNSLGQGIK